MRTADDPAHGTLETVKLHDAYRDARFYSVDLWPPNSPDLNPVGYQIWATMFITQKPTTVI